MSKTFYRFTPEMIPEEDLVAASVGRERMIEDMVATLRHAASGGSTAHILLVGPRGIGKTNTMLRLQAKLKKFPELEVARLSEEEYSISSINDLLFRILEEVGVEPDRNDVEAQAVSTFADMKKRGKSLVVVAENLQMVFAQMSRDMPKLRSFLQEYEPLCIVGSATGTFDEISSYDKPFYNFMNVRILHGLDEEETIGLIRRRMAHVKNTDLDEQQYKRRMSCIRALTGGNPRLIHFMCDIMLREDTLPDLQAHLTDLLDQLTPYYQARMDGLPPMQRKILDCMALARGPITPTALGKTTGMNTSSVVTQLRRMSGDGLVEQAKLRSKRETPYQVSESLYRIWREMRTANGHKRVMFFADFIEMWYSEKETLEQHARLSRKILHDCWFGNEQAAKDNLFALACAASAVYWVFGLAVPLNADLGRIVGDREFLSIIVHNAKEHKAPNPLMKTVHAASLRYARRALADVSEDGAEAARRQRWLDKAEDRLLSALRTTRDAHPDLRDAIHVWCHQWVGAYSAPDALQAKYAKLLDTDGGSCILCMMNSALTKISAGHYREALNVLDKIPSKRLGSLAALKIPCLAMTGRIKDAEKNATDLASGKQKHAHEAVASLKWADPDIACRVASRVLSCLSSKGGLDKAVTEKVAYGLSEILAAAFKFKKPIYNLKKISKIGCHYGVSTSRVCSRAVLHLANSGDLDGALELLDIAKEWDLELLEGHVPILHAAITHIKTGNTDVLEALHKDVRDLTVDMTKRISRTQKLQNIPLCAERSQGRFLH